MTLRDKIGILPGHFNILVGSSSGAFGFRETMLSLPDRRIASTL